MSFELIFPKGKEPVVKETLGGAGLRNLTAAAGQALNTIPNLINLPERLQTATQQRGIQSAQQTLGNPNVPENLKVALRRYTQESERNQESLISPAKIQDKANKAAASLFPEGYLEPKNELESNIQDVLANIGFNTAAFLGTGGTLPTAAAGGKFLYEVGKRSLQGKAGKYAAKAAGLGDLGQLIAEIGTPTALEALNVNNLVKGLSPIRQELYEKAQDNARFKKVDAGNIKKYLENKLDSKFLKTPEHKDIRSNLIKTYESIDKNNKIDVLDAFKIKTNLNDLLHESKLADTARKDYKPLQAMFNEVLDSASKEFPDFGKFYKPANNLTRISSEANKTSQFIKDAFEKSTFMNKPIAYVFKTPVKTTRQAVNALSASGQLLIDHPKQFMEYYKKALESASKKQLQPFLKNVGNMDKLIKEEKNNGFELIF